VPREPNVAAPRGTGSRETIRDEVGAISATSHETSSGGAANEPLSDVAALTEALRAEYGLLATTLASVWSASLSRVSLFLGVVSAIGVGLGFAAQAGDGFGGTFRIFALIALPLALFLGLGTFVRTIELQREAFVYITGMNRIRHAITEAAPGSRPYLVLSIYDDPAGVYRSQGTGIRLRPPRYRLVFALVQTQGIVAVICGALAGIIGGLATAWISETGAWIVAAVAFVVVAGGLLRYWSRSFAQLEAAVRPMFPTPPEAFDEPI
jgi:hypothetical protein